LETDPEGGQGRPWSVEPAEKNIHCAVRVQNLVPQSKVKNMGVLQGEDYCHERFDAV